MSFEGGSISFRLFYLPRDLPNNAVERFTKFVVPPLQHLKEAPVNGWVTGRHLLDRQINKDTAYFGGYLRMTLMRAERKIPTSLFRAECRMEELARQQAMGVAALPAKIRGEIKKQITERLLPTMPPTLKGITLVYDENSRLMFVSALSEKQVEAFNVSFGQTMQMQPILLTPSSMAAWRRKVDVRDWDPASFSPEVESEPGEETVGLDFLTWLLFASEARGGIFQVPDIGEVGVMVEGPLMFVMEGAGAHEAVLRKGEPVFSVEAKTALMSGKKLRRAKVSFARGNETWQCTLDAQDFAFRSLRLPDTEALDPVGRFQERMRHLDTFNGVLFGMYERFLDERADAGRWASTLKEVHKWLADRGARK